MAFKTTLSDEGKFSMFFLKPKKALDIHSVARRLATKKGIKEVLITEGAYGFIVKASEDCHGKVFDGISDDYRKVTCHYKYRGFESQR